MPPHKQTAIHSGSAEGPDIGRKLTKDLYSAIRIGKIFGVSDNVGHNSSGECAPPNFGGPYKKAYWLMAKILLSHTPAWVQAQSVAVEYTPATMPISREKCEKAKGDAPLISTKCRLRLLRGSS
jgi:hypothetical protein